MTSPPHLNLTVSSLGVKSHHQPQNTKNKENKITHKAHKTKQTHTRTLNLHRYTQASSLSQKHLPNQKQDHTYIQN